MEYADKLRGILELQRSQLQEMERFVSGIESMDLAGENDRLSARLLESESAIAALEKSVNELTAENKRLTSALTEQMLDRRLGLTLNSKKLIEAYYSEDERKSDNRLTALEARCKAQLKLMNEAAAKDYEMLDARLRDSLKSLEDEVNAALLECRRKNHEMHDEVKTVIEAEYGRLSESPVTPAQMARIAKMNNLEMKLGTNVANIAGVILILLGVIFGLQYTYVHFLRSNELKGAAAFLLGVLFLLAGEYFSRKGRNVFSTGMSAGGIAILFASTALSYFSLRILSMYPAIAVCILVTASAFLLSIRYNSRTIAVFALLGGYLPMLAVADAMTSDLVILYSAMVYFLILNLFTLLLASRKKWPFFNILSFVLHWLEIVLLYAWFFRTVPTQVSILYLFVTFLMYVGVILVNPILAKGRISGLDAAVLSLNTAFNCMAVYFLLNRNVDFEYNGLLAIAFFAVYYVGGRLLDRFMEQDTRASIIFYVTAFTFAVLIVPFQFGVKWLMLGWLVEGATTAVIGILKKEKWYERAGLMITVLCYAAFIYDLATFKIFYEQDLFFIQSTCMTAGLICILAAYHYAYASDALFRHSRKGVLVGIFQFVQVIFTYIYALYASTYIFYRVPLKRKPELYLFVAMICVNFIYAFAIRRFKPISGKRTVILSLVLSVLGLAALLCVNANRVWYRQYDPVSNVVVLILFNIFSVCVLYEFMSQLAKLTKRGESIAQWIALAVSAYALVLTMLVLTVQFSFGIENMILSVILIGTSLAWIVFGFVRRNKIMRLSGLGLSLFSTAKLFLMDLSFLRNELRILSYFIFGIALIAISFAYQYWDRKTKEGS